MSVLVILITHHSPVFQEHVVEFLLTVVVALVLSVLLGNTVIPIIFALIYQFARCVMLVLAIVMHQTILLAGFARHVSAELALTKQPIGEMMTIIVLALIENVKQVLA
jgi:hypothetical protein